MGGGGGGEEEKKGEVGRGDERRKREWVADDASCGCRMLLLDEKSCPSLAAVSPTPGHSRKGSGSSLVSTNSSNSQFSNQLSNDGEEGGEGSVVEDRNDVFVRKHVCVFVCVYVRERMCVFLG